jgi:hypothetical protein
MHVYTSCQRKEGVYCFVYNWDILKKFVTRLVVDSILCQQDLIICSGNVLFQFVALPTLFIVGLLTRLFVCMLTRLQDCKTS